MATPLVLRHFQVAGCCGGLARVPSLLLPLPPTCPQQMSMPPSPVHPSQSRAPPCTTRKRVVTVRPTSRMMVVQQWQQKGRRGGGRALIPAATIHPAPPPPEWTYGEQFKEVGQCPGPKLAHSPRRRVTHYSMDDSPKTSLCGVEEESHSNERCPHFSLGSPPFSSQSNALGPR